jgi:hypothetical protein
MRPGPYPTQAGGATPASPAAGRMLVKGHSESGIRVDPARRPADSLHTADVDSLNTQALDQPVAERVLAHRGREPHPQARAGRGHRLIRSLAAVAL